jgi:signal peptidase I
MTIRRLAKPAGYLVAILVTAVLVFGLVEYAIGVPPFLVETDRPSSMSPTLNYGDLAVVYKADFSSIGKGAVIAFNDPRGNPTIIVHRVVSVVNCGGATCLVTKGDNNSTNPSRDPWNVTESDYLGEVILMIPYAGYISPALWGFSGYYALLPITAIAAAFVLWDVMVYKGRKTNGGGTPP